jgi:hypothetical protein
MARQSSSGYRKTAIHYKPKILSVPGDRSMPDHARQNSRTPRLLSVPGSKTKQRSNKASPSSRNRSPAVATSASSAAASPSAAAVTESARKRRNVGKSIVADVRIGMAPSGRLIAGSLNMWK